MWWKRRRVHWWIRNLEIYLGWRWKKNEKEPLDQAQSSLDWKIKCQEKGWIKKLEKEKQEKDPN